MNLRFETIIPTEIQIERLYALLNGRNHKISHSHQPSYVEHKTFVEQNPYRVWLLVIDNDGSDIGTVYLSKENNIGINIKEACIKTFLREIIDKITSEFEPLPAIKSVRANHFAINVPPSNKMLISELEAQGYPLAQLTFRV